MKKIFFSLLFICASYSIMLSQSISSFYLKPGGSFTSFQDLKYSQTSYSGIGGLFDLGLSMQGVQSSLELGFFLNIGNEQNSVHSNGNSLVVNPKVYTRYLKKINDQLSLGGQWDIFGLYFRSTSGLGNNSSYILSSSDLLVAADYKYKKFNFGMDLGIASFIRESTGFAFSAPQSVLEDGVFNLQDEKINSPFSLDYFVLRSVFNHLNLRTNISYHLNDHFSIKYNWDLRRFAEVKNYPVTIGAHYLTVYWKFRDSNPIPNSKID